MDRRAELGKIFREILGNGNVYFQPPSNTQMRYPAIRYERSEMAIKHADNGNYYRCFRYTVTVIDSDPDSEIVNRVSMLKCHSASLISNCRIPHLGIAG